MNGTVKPKDVIKVIKPLDPILADGSVWTIMVDGYDRVFVDRGGKVEQVASPFGSEEELQALIDGLFGLYGIKLDATNPVGHLRLPDHSRAMAIVPPNAVEGPHLVLHRIAGMHMTLDKIRLRFTVLLFEQILTNQKKFNIFHWLPGHVGIHGDIVRNSIK